MNLVDWHKYRQEIDAPLRFAYQIKQTLQYCIKLIDAKDSDFS